MTIFLSKRLSVAAAYLTLFCVAGLVIDMLRACL